MHKDYSAEVQLVKNPIARKLLLWCGHLMLALGLIGVLLPILPTTPFLLLAAACYSRSSNRFYHWLLNNKYFGSYIRQWRHEQCIPVRAKVFAIATLVVTMGISIVFFVKPFALKVLMASIGLGVSLYILSFPSHSKPHR